MALQVGSRLGPYEIVALIGAGGMGEVYRGRDTRLGRSVAIKILPDRTAGSPDALARFEREARALAALSHPNIVTIHDFGSDLGVSYAVTEFLDGRTLRDLLTGGPLPPARGLDYALQVARGLAAAHARGIVHRDLKPENVMVSADHVVKLLDFGVAKLIESPAADAPTVLGDTARGTMRGTGASMSTEPGTVLGTVGYMSPEQVRGEPTDARTDVFAFGAILYEMLSGGRAFARKSGADTIAAILIEHPPALPLAEPLARALDRISRRCLEKNPELRMQSGQDLVTALEELRRDVDSGRPITSAGPVAASASGAMTPRAGQVPSIAVLPFVDLSPDRSLEYFCDGVAEEIMTGLARLGGLRVVSRTSAFQFKGKAEDARQLGRMLNVQTILEGSVRSAGNKLRIMTQLVDTTEGYQLWSEKFDRSLDDVFAVQDEIARAVVSTLQVRLRPGQSGVLIRPHTQDLEAYTAYLKGRHYWNRRTEGDLTRSIQHFKEAIERDPAYAQAHAALAEAYSVLGVYGVLPPTQIMPQAKAEARRALEITDGLPEAFASLGSVLATYDWAWAESEDCFTRALAIGPEYATGHQWYANDCLLPQARFEEAERALARALELDPLALAINASVGVQCYFRRRHEDAVRALLRTLDLDKGFAMARLFLGNTYVAMGRYDDAVKELELADQLSGGSPDITAGIGYALARAGNRARAEAVLGELVALSATRWVSPSLIAEVHAALGQTTAALDWLETAYEQRCSRLAWVAVRPVLDNVVGEPRFQRLLELMKLGDAASGQAV